MQVICIDDKGRPDEIPVTRWVKKGERYNVIDLIKCVSQPGQPIAYVLAEIDLSGFGFYKGFSSHRFAVVVYTPEAELKAEEALAPC